jgi:hypothetical protein
MQDLTGGNVNDRSDIMGLEVKKSYDFREQTSVYCSSSDYQE